MSDRQSPDLSTAGGTGYRRGGGSGGNRPSEKSRGGTGRMIGMNLMVALLIAGLVVAGWFIANQQQLIVDQESALTTAVSRIEQLENRTSATDQALSSEGQSTKQQLGFWEDEIRKLWDVSNKRNRTWIEDNKRDVAKLNKTIDSIESTSRDLNAAVGRHESAFEQQQAMIDQLASLELQMQQIVRGQRDLVDKVNVASRSVASLKAGLAGKVDDNAEAIQSIDAFRVAINSRLLDIERRIGVISGSPGQ